MLQQTQVATVIPYFERFMQSFSTLGQLAAADLDEVLKHWAGLGYYARARNLHKTAGVVRDKHEEKLPSDLQQLMELPGIGRSTAGAILSLAYGQGASILDGNVKRVLARVYQVAGWSGQSATLKKLWTLAEQQTPGLSVAHYNQAMMDLGSIICKRSKPLCDQCPLTSLCLSYQQNTQADYPQAKPRKARPHKHRWMLLHTYGNQLLLERRPEQGIWGGLWSLPELESLDELESWQQKNIGCSHEAKQCRQNLVKHQFSHFDLSISIAQITVPLSNLDPSSLAIKEMDDLLWVKYEQLKQFGMPAPIYKLLAEPF